MVRVLETTNLAELQYPRGILFVPIRISYVSGNYCDVIFYLPMFDLKRNACMSSIIFLQMDTLE